MAIFIATFFYEDSLSGSTSKSFSTDQTDFAAAKTLASSLLIDLNAATKSTIPRWTLTEEITPGGTPAANTNVFERVSATVKKTNTAQANMKFPNPVDAIMTGNSLIIGDSIWTNLMANFASDWSFSDGEFYASTVKGSRVNVNSGKTNLPT